MTGTAGQQDRDPGRRHDRAWWTRMIIFAVLAVGFILIVVWPSGGGDVGKNLW